MSAVTTKSAASSRRGSAWPKRSSRPLRGEFHAAGFLQRGGKGHHAHDEDEARPLDGFVGAVERDAAREAEQQAGDERGERIRHPAGDHERDHDGELPSAYGARLRAGATWSISAGRLSTRKSRFCFCNSRMCFHRPMTSSVSPGRSFSAETRARQRLALAAQADDVQPVFAAKTDLEHALADEFGIRRQQHFRHAEVARLIGEIATAQRQRLEFQLGQLPQASGSSAREHRRAARRARTVARRRAARATRAVRPIQRSMATIFAHRALLPRAAARSPRLAGICANADAVLAAGELVIAHEIHQVAARAYPVAPDRRRDSASGAR